MQQNSKVLDVLWPQTSSECQVILSFQHNQLTSPEKHTRYMYHHDHGTFSILGCARGSKYRRCRSINFG